MRTFPYDILNGWPGITTRFDLVYDQELTPTRGAVQNSADLGPAMWEMDVESKILKPTEVRLWRARVNSLEDGKYTLRGYDMTANFPLLYPRGTWPGSSFTGSGLLNAVNAANYKEMKVGSLPNGYVISEGDYFSFNYAGYRALHQAMESVSVGPSGISPYFEVRPAIRPGYVLGETVDLTRPHAVMVIIPGSVSSNIGSEGKVSFSARQTISTG